MLRTLIALTAWLGLTTGISAQATPIPLGQTHASALAPLAQIPLETVAPLDRPAIAVQDTIRDALGQPCRYAIPTAVQVSPATHGQWEPLDNTRDLWRLRVRAPGASHVNLGFGSFDLPQGAQLQVYSHDYSYVVRPFDSNDNNAARELWTPVVLSDEVVVELCVPTALRAQTLLELTSINSGYRFFGAGTSAVAPPEGGSCNVDVACPQGLAWAGEIPSVAAISTGGSVFCTGFMVNNTAQDGRPLFMTAYHCGVRSSGAASLVAYWNYQNTTCNGGGAGLNQFSTGSVLRAGYSPSDFTLVEFNNQPNVAWGVTYAGWNATGATGTSAVAIHHPSGCEKKISFENQPTTTTSYLSNSVPGDGTHVRVIDWDTGTTEPGSSGSPLFNQNHEVIGQLHGGGAACGNNLSDWYGKLSVSWTGGGSNNTRLSNWLDPIGTGLRSIGTLGAVQPGLFSVYGQGCLGADQTTGTCGRTNPAGGTLAGLRTSHEYAYAIQNTGTVQISGFEIYTRAVGGPTSVIVALYHSQGGQPAAVPTRAGQLAVGTAPGFYQINFSAPVTVTGNYYLGVDHTAQTTVVSQLTSGGSGTAFRRGSLLSGPWSAAANVSRPSFRVLCTPIASIPTIDNQGVARVNQSFSITLGDAAPNALALLFLGFSNTAWSGGALPSPLPNAPGCNVLMSADDWASTLTSGAGTGSITLNVPNVGSLVGIQAHHQWFVADPAANLLGVAVSAGATSTVGG